MSAEPAPASGRYAAAEPYPWPFDGALRPGMYASVRVARQDAAQALTVPETAVTYTAYGETVFIAKARHGQPLTVQRVAVKAGERLGGRVQIETG